MDRTIGVLGKGGTLLDANSADLRTDDMDESLGGSVNYTVRNGDKRHGEKRRETAQGWAKRVSPYRA